MLLVHLLTVLGLLVFPVAHGLALAAEVATSGTTDGPLPLAAGSIRPYLPSALQETVQNLGARGVIDGLLKLSPRQLACVDPGYGVCLDGGGGCCPLGGDCCSNGGCCDPGFRCYSRVCCRRDYVGCANRGCCSVTSTCCSNGLCCRSGYYCVIGGCCRIGEICSGSSGQCTRSGYSPCPDEDFCCPTGARCYRDSSGPACRSTGITTTSTTTSTIAAQGPTTTSSNVISDSMPPSDVTQTTISADQGGFPGNAAAHSTVIAHQGAYFMFTIVLPLFHFLA